MINDYAYLHTPKAFLLMINLHLEAVKSPSIYITRLGELCFSQPQLADIPDYIQ